MEGFGSVERAGDLYAEGRERLTGIARRLGPAAAATPVPACPGWTVHDLFAHLAGSCAAAVAGELEGVTTAAWADAQVAARRDRTMEELLEEWSAAASVLERAGDPLPQPLATVWVLDLTAHEHDVRGALGRPEARDSPAVLMAVDFLVREGLDARLLDTGAGPLALRTPIRSWTVGGPPAATPSASVPTLSSSLFELFRALTGRRRTAQIARLAWTADPGPFLPSFEFGTFRTRADDLVE